MDTITVGTKSVSRRSSDWSKSIMTRTAASLRKFAKGVNLQDYVRGHSVLEGNIFRLVTEMRPDFFKSRTDISQAASQFQR